VAQDIQVDINSDGTNDYTVNVALPTCTRAVIASNGAKSGVGLVMGASSGKTWYTDWDLQATVADSITGAGVVVHQGVRVLLTDTQKTAVCASPL
jgi:hypothetical protein